MKTKLTPTQLLCLISIAILIAIGCHNQAKQTGISVIDTKNDSGMGIDSISTLTIEHVGINRFWYNDIVQFTINGHDNKGRYLMHIDKHRLKWVNDTTAVYYSYNPIDTTTFITNHSEIK